MVVNYKIKILIVNTSAVLGGGNTISNSLAAGLNKNFFEVFTFFSDKGIAADQIEKEVKVIFPPKSNFIYVFNFLRDFIQKNKINIINAQGTRAAFWVRLASIGIKDKPKVIYTLHGLHIIRKSFLIRYLLIILERFLNQWTDILVCVSNSDRDLVLKYKTISPKKIVFIKHGIDIEKFQVDQFLIKNTKEKLGLSNNFILTSVARLHHQKDFSTILKAFKIIILQNKNFRLLLVGGGSLRKSLENEKKNLDLNDYVKFLGVREDVPVLMNLSDIIILSTNWEALGLVCLEAGACRKPIIASNISGVREAVLDKKTGYLFNFGSEKDLADKILKLSESKELRDSLGEAGYDFVSKNFRKEEMIQEYQNLYQSLL